MLEIVEKIAIHIVNNLKDTPEEIKRVNKAIETIAFEFGYPTEIKFISRHRNNLVIEYTDCNGFVELIYWEEFKQQLPAFIWFEEDCVRFVKTYMREE